jgi:hypothetical protein
MFHPYLTKSLQFHPQIFEVPIGFPLDPQGYQTGRPQVGKICECERGANAKIEHVELIPVEFLLCS